MGNCEIITKEFGGNWCIDSFVLENPSFLFRAASRITVGLVGLFSRILVGNGKGLKKLSIGSISSLTFSRYQFFDLSSLAYVVKFSLVDSTWQVLEP